MGENSEIQWTTRANPLTGRPGPAPKPPRDGDRKQARQRINVEVRTGRQPHPNTLPCVDCGHVWSPGERRHGGASGARDAKGRFRKGNKRRVREFPEVRR